MRVGSESRWERPLVEKIGLKVDIIEFKRCSQKVNLRNRCRHFRRTMRTVPSNPPVSKKKAARKWKSDVYPLYHAVSVRSNLLAVILVRSNHEPFTSDSFASPLVEAIICLFLSSVGSERLTVGIRVPGVHRSQEVRHHASCHIVRLCSTSFKSLILILFHF